MASRHRAKRETLGQSKTNGQGRAGQGRPAHSDRQDRLFVLVQVTALPFPTLTPEASNPPPPPTQDLGLWEGAGEFHGRRKFRGAAWGSEISCPGWGLSQAGQSFLLEGKSASQGGGVCRARRKTNPDKPRISSWSPKGRKSATHAQHRACSRRRRRWCLEAHRSAPSLSPPAVKSDPGRGV